MQSKLRVRRIQLDLAILNCSVGNFGTNAMQRVAAAQAIVVSIVWDSAGSKTKEPEVEILFQSDDNSTRPVLPTGYSISISRNSFHVKQLFDLR